MSEISVNLNQSRKNPNFNSTKSLNPFGSSTDNDHYEKKDNDITNHVLDPDSLTQTEKFYDIKPKSIFSAFHWSSLSHTILRLLLLKQGINYIVYEISIITIRSILENLVVCCFSRRTARKLLKDAPESSNRKAQRGMPSTVYFGAVTRTIFRAHCLGVLAIWIVRVGIHIFNILFYYLLFSSKYDIIQVNKTEEFDLLGVTLNCATSLVVAAIGGGFGATLIHPSLGVLMGYAAGYWAGPVFVRINKLLHTR